MADDFDLDAYFARIGYGGPARPDLATLSALHAAQVDAIPFESLDPLTGRPVKLDLASLQAKLVGGRRGGYCFELNHLFRAALEAIGFEVTGLGGRVVWMSPPEAPLRRLHMLLKVDVGGAPYLADVGFGAHLQDAPLRFEIGLEQETPVARYRLQQRGRPHGAGRLASGRVAARLCVRPDAAAAARLHDRQLVRAPRRRTSCSPACWSSSG